MRLRCGGVPRLRSLSPELLRVQRDFEVEKFLAGRGLVNATDVELRAFAVRRLEVEEPAGRLAGGEHLRRERAALDLPCVERILFLASQTGRAAPAGLEPA